MPADESLPPPTRLSTGVLLWVLLLFVGSGCAALVYELVWFQLLELIIGSTTISLAWLLAMFMGGMCLGSLAPRRLWPQQANPLRVYAALELGIALLALGVLWVMPVLGQLYVQYAQAGWPGLVLRGALCGACLLPPTLLMGATLPTIARWVEQSPRGVSWLGWFYGGNTFGAVLGCLLAGFWLLHSFDLTTATYFAMGINGLIALLGWLLSTRLPNQRALAEPLESDAAPRRDARWMYLVAALSGCTALGAEVVWTRMISLALGNTTYTFSLILAGFLIGIGVGSAAGAWIARHSTDLRGVLGMCQLFLVAALAWTGWVVARSFPYLPLGAELPPSEWRGFMLDLIRCALAVLPGALLWGASFPLALAVVSRGGRPHATQVGRLYAANTAGAIVGALLFSLLVIPPLGTLHAQQLLAALALVSSLLVMIPWLYARDAQRNRPVIAFAGWVVGSVLVTFWLEPLPTKVVGWGRLAPQINAPIKELFRGEGLNSTVAVIEQEHGLLSFHVSGKVEASNSVDDMRLQRMLANLPALFHPQPRSVLVVGCGAGVTAGSFLPYLDVRRLVICEIEPLVPQVVAKYFATQNSNVLADPAVSVVYDDARHYMLTSRESFDVITSDPIHPWVKGAATLYTQEYFEHVRDHLRPGGMAVQWVPLYESNEAAVKSELATFFRVFPHGSVWSNALHGNSHDLVLIGSVEPLEIDLGQLQARLEQDEMRFARSALKQVGFESIVDVCCSYAGSAADLAAWLADAELNRDGNLRLQYLAAISPRGEAYRGIHAELLRHRRFREELFVGDEELRRALRARLSTQPTQ